MKRINDKSPTANESTKITSFADGVNYAVNLFSSIKILTLIRAVLLILVIIGLIFTINIAMNQEAVEKIVTHAIERDEKDDLSIRAQVSPKISRDLVDLIYSLDCDRAFIIELHNGKKNSAELPFEYFDITYEEVNENRHVKHISQYFTDVLVSHYKFPFYLTERTLFMGNAEELKKIDRRFGDNFEEHDGKYLAMITLRSTENDVGFLGVAYNYDNKVKSKEIIKHNLSEKAKIIRELLDLSVQKNNIR